MNKREIGKMGEDLAAKYLSEIGYEILCQNYWTRYSEVDIIAQKDDELVFVEVKLRKNNSYGSGIEAITKKKTENIMAAAQHYLDTHCDVIPACRFDCIEVVFNNNWEILHTKNAF